MLQLQASHDVLRFVCDIGMFLFQLNDELDQLQFATTDRLSALFIMEVPSRHSNESLVHSLWYRILNVALSTF
jgi:hypothetical protein